jgi:hypothetical protein
MVGQASSACKLDKAVQKANDDLAKFAGRETSFLGLEKPLFQLKNPGIISIPLGFLAVLLGSLLFRDKRSESLWPEVYARQNTGILASGVGALTLARPSRVARGEGNRKGGREEGAGVSGFVFSGICIGSQLRLHFR